MDTFTAELSIRHPNVPGSARSMVFKATAVVDPAVAAAAAAAQSTSSALGTSTASATAALPVRPALNPLLNPRVAMLVQFPRMTAAGYGGVTRAVADFSAIVAETAGLDGPSWVTATAVNSTPLVMNATVRSGVNRFWDLWGSSSLHT